MTADARHSEGETWARQGALQSCTARLADIDVQNAEQKQQQLMRMMEQVMKALREMQMGTVRRLH